MKTEFIEILKTSRNRIENHEDSFICTSILSQIDKKNSNLLNTYYESSLYEILATVYFSDKTLIQILESYIDKIEIMFFRDKLRVLWIDFFIGHILTIPNGVETEKSILDAAGKATTSLICFIENGDLNGN